MEKATGDSGDGRNVQNEPKPFLRHLGPDEHSLTRDKLVPLVTKTSIPRLEMIKDAGQDSIFFLD